MTETAWGGPTPYNKETGDDAIDMHVPGAVKKEIEFVHPGEEDTFSPNGERPMRFSEVRRPDPDALRTDAMAVAFHDME